MEVYAESVHWLPQCFYFKCTSCFLLTGMQDEIKNALKFMKLQWKPMQKVCIGHPKTSILSTLLLVYFYKLEYKFKLSKHSCASFSSLALCTELGHFFTLTFTFINLANVFIQSNFATQIILHFFVKVEF